MEIAIWILAILAVIIIVLLYVITSVSSYSNSFIGKFFKEEKNRNDTEQKNINEKSDSEKKSL
ncbi:MAG: hypothetical protein LH629_05265 [Ignavibacteria bacterium]|nr:hypothetical protein [Ignavibacteria bacterium]